MSVSPSRRFFSTKTGVDYSLIDAESFQPLAKWSSKEAVHVHFTDTLLAGICTPDFDLCIREFHQPWHPIRVAGIKQHLEAFRYQGPTFVNDSTFVMAEGSELKVVTLEGAMLFSANLPKKFSFARIATSTGGKRFGYIETELRGSTALDMYSDFDDHMVAYDLGQKKAIYTRKVKGGFPWIPPFEHDSNCIVSRRTLLQSWRTE